MLHYNQIKKVINIYYKTELLHVSNVLIFRYRSLTDEFKCSIK